MSTKPTSSKDALSFLESITGEKLSLGSLLRTTRLADGETQEEFGKKLGITKQHVSNIENGRTHVSASLAATYAIKLGYSEAQFIRLSLQDQVNKDNLGYSVKLEPIAKKADKKKAA